MGTISVLTDGAKSEDVVIVIVVGCGFLVDDAHDDNDLLMITKGDDTMTMGGGRRCR
jgi:hypothetical protein